MKVRFLSVGLVGASFLTGSVLSVKLVEINLFPRAPAEVRQLPSNRSAESIDAPERINFRRGTFGETVSGIVTQGKRYVLAAKDGQYLSARLSSPNNCVVFDSGTTSLNFTTVSGDNSLTVANNCGGPSTFGIAVEIR